MITQQFGFPDASVKVLRDSGKPGEDLPNKANIQVAIGWLVAGAKAGDHLMMHYSGHGGQVVDQNSDESDGYDGACSPLQPIKVFLTVAK